MDTISASTSRTMAWSPLTDCLNGTEIEYEISLAAIGGAWLRRVPRSGARERLAAVAGAAAERRVAGEGAAQRVAEGGAEAALAYQGCGIWLRQPGAGQRAHLSAEQPGQR